MCASYGLDPRFGDYKGFARANDREMMQNLRDWAAKKAEREPGEPMRPTGKNLRNLNPIFRDMGEGPHLESAWWGYLVNGQPSKFPSINTRSERLQQKPIAMNGRAIVPATSWFEMQKPSRTWYRFELGDLELLGMAAVTQRGWPSGGEQITCYSIVMQPAREDLVDLHDRMPLLIPGGFAEEWLAAEPSRELIDAAIDAGREIAERVRATAVPR